MYRTLCLFALTLVLAGCPSEAPSAVQTDSSPASTDEGPAETPDAPDAPDAPDTPKGPEGLDGSKEAEQAIGTMAMGRDPVCKMDVDLNKVAAQHVWGDETFVFCSEGCADKFKKDPKTYVRKK